MRSVESGTELRRVGHGRKANHVNLVFSFFNLSRYWNHRSFVYKKLKNDEIIIDKLDQLLHEMKSMNKDNSG